MNLHITTTDLKNRPYIHDTMKSLLQSNFSQPIVLFICGKPNYLEQYHNLPNITFVPWTTLHTRPRMDCKMNGVKALLYNNTGPVLICEDDVLFVQDWQNKLNKIIKQIPEADYVLDIGKLGVNGHSNNIPYKNEIPWGKVGSGLQGSWGMYYSSQKVRDKVGHDLEKRNDGCNDVIIGKIAKENFCLYVSRERLIEHIGALSTF
jgi:hypothetical protein